MDTQVVISSALNPATWIAGRIAAVFATSDESHVVVCSDRRPSATGDLNKGEDFRACFIVSTDGGDTWSSLAYAIDESGAGIGVTDVCLVPGPNDDLYLFVTTDKDLTAGQSPFTYLSPVAYSKATRAGDYADWSALTYLSLFPGMDTNNICSGTGFYDAASDTMVVPFYGYATGDRWRMFPLYKTGAGAWTRGSMVSSLAAAPGGEGEYRIIKLADGYWYILSRSNVEYTWRYAYRTLDLDGTWDSIANVGRLYAVSNNLGLCVTDISGVETVLYSSSDYPTTIAGASPNSTDTRRLGVLMGSTDEMLSWRVLARLTNGAMNISADFFAYSCVAASDDTIFAAYEADNYTTIRLTRIPKSEITATLSFTY